MSSGMNYIEISTVTGVKAMVNMDHVKMVTEQPGGKAVVVPIDDNQRPWQTGDSYQDIKCRLQPPGEGRR